MEPSVVMAIQNFKSKNLTVAAHFLHLETLAFLPVTLSTVRFRRTMTYVSFSIVSFVFKTVIGMEKTFR